MNEVELLVRLQEVEDLLDEMSKAAGTAVEVAECQQRCPYGKAIYRWARGTGSADAVEKAKCTCGTYATLRLIESIEEKCQAYWNKYGVTE